MAVIHRTTLQPGKLELLTAWLPAQDWYRGTGTPRLTKAGGFRVDDPEGEVGLEFMVVTDDSGPRSIAYHVPMAYRGAPLADGAEGLIGTMEHGVLGTRWVYDGAHDPVLVAQALALLTGRARAQAQNESDTLDPTVEVYEAAMDAPITLRINRVPQFSDSASEVRGRVTGPWRACDGTTERGALLEALVARP